MNVYISFFSLISIHAIDFGVVQHNVNVFHGDQPSVERFVENTR